MTPEPHAALCLVLYSSCTHIEVFIRLFMLTSLYLCVIFLCERKRLGVIFICDHRYDMALRGNTVNNEAHSCSLVRHPCQVQTS